MQTVRVHPTQNVFIDQPDGSVGDRISAYRTDALILILYLVATGSFPVRLDVEAWHVWLIVPGVPAEFYFPAFEILMNGQTPGRRAMTRVGNIVTGTSVVRLVRRQEISAQDVNVLPGRLLVPTFNHVAFLKEDQESA